MKRYAIINTETNVVENVIDYAEEPGNPPPGFSDIYICIQSDNVGPGWRYEDGVLVDTTLPPSPSPFTLP